MFGCSQRLGEVYRIVGMIKGFMERKERLVSVFGNISSGGGCGLKHVIWRNGLLGDMMRLRGYWLIDGAWRRDSWRGAAAWCSVN